MPEASNVYSKAEIPNKSATPEGSNIRQVGSTKHPERQRNISTETIGAQQRSDSKLSIYNSSSCLIGTCLP